MFTPKKIIYATPVGVCLVCFVSKRKKILWQINVYLNKLTVAIDIGLSRLNPCVLKNELHLQESSWCLWERCRIYLVVIIIIYFLIKM